MNHSPSIRTKILLPLSLVVIITLATVTGILSNTMTKIARDDALSISMETGGHYGSMIEDRLDKAMTTARTLSHTIEGSMTNPENMNRDQITSQLKHILESNPSFFATWAVFEPDALDHRDAHFRKHDGVHDETGRYYPYIYRENGHIAESTNSDFEEDFYQIPKKSDSEVIMTPYMEELSGETDTVLMTNVAVPVRHNGRFIGAIGIDIVLDDLDKIIRTITPYDTGYAFLVAGDGTLVTHPDKNLVMTNFSEILGDDSSDVLASIKNGRNIQLERKSVVDSTLHISTFVPFTIGKSSTPWALCVSIPEHEILQKANKARIIAIILAICGIMILIAIVAFLIEKVILHPVTKVSSGLAEIADGNGDLTRRLEITSKDELGELATHFNKFITNLEAIIGHVKHTTDMVHTATQEVSAGTQGLAQSTEEQASAVEDGERHHRGNGVNSKHQRRPRQHGKR